jgi:hypothetical protein
MRLRMYQYVIEEVNVCVYLCMFVYMCHVMWIPCRHGMARPQVADGGDCL